MLMQCTNGAEMTTGPMTPDQIITSPHLLNVKEEHEEPVAVIVK